MLAGLRVGLDLEELQATEDWGLPPQILQALLETAGLLAVTGKPIPEATRSFLEAPRGEALILLAGAWLHSTTFNELRLMPDLMPEGKWENDAQAARGKILAFARTARKGQWWSIPALIADVKERQAEFQRPAADYDSWYLRPAAGGDYLRGFAHWDEVDGALIAFVIRGPLHHLGFVDLAGAAEDQPALAFRWSAWAQALLKGVAPQIAPVEEQKLKVDSQGKVLIPEATPRAVRYLVARFCEWLPRQKDAYAYQISAASLGRAKKQGLEVSQLVSLFKKNSSGSLPPNLLQALKRWDQQGTETLLGRTLVLRVKSAAALKALRASRAARYLGEPLGPTAIVVKDGAGLQVLRALLELGYLGELEEEKQA